MEKMKKDATPAGEAGGEEKSTPQGDAAQSANPAADSASANPAAEADGSENAAAGNGGESVAAPDGDAPADGQAAELEELRAKLKAAEDRALRTMADFDNFRKRSLRDREDFARIAAGDVIKAILPTADNLERALASAPADDPFAKGVRLSYDSFLAALAANGASKIETDGKDFDPNFHEALAQTPSATVPAGKIAETYRTGWMLNGKLLRAAQVVVSSGPAEEKTDKGE